MVFFIEHVLQFFFLKIIIHPIHTKNI